MPIKKSGKTLLTLLDLMNSTIKHFPKFADRSDSCDFRNFTSSWDTLSTYNISTNAYSLESKKLYSTRMSFYNLSEKDVGKLLVTLPVKVICSCQAYYFWFIYANAKANANIGGMNFRKYVRITPKTDPRYPEKNPHNYPGLCKHLFYLATQINNANLKLPPRG